jgi:hypothetical protein
MNPPSFGMKDQQLMPRQAVFQWLNLEPFQVPNSAYPQQLLAGSAASPFLNGFQ